MVAELVALLVDQRGVAADHARVQRTQLDARSNADRSTPVVEQTSAGHSGRGRLRRRVVARARRTVVRGHAAATAAETTEVSIKGAFSRVKFS